MRFSASSAPTPAIVTQAGARRLPRLVLLLLGLAYVLPGLLGRDPWRNADLASFGAMLDMARWNGQGSGQWLQPQVLGQAAELPGWLPYWLGALFIQGLPFLPPDLAARIPFGLLLVLALVATWYAAYHLARLPAAQPVSFAFGGEARPVDYARAMADTALLALVASMGLALLAHESGPSVAQVAFVALLLYACARLARGLLSPHHTHTPGYPEATLEATPEAAWSTAAVWWLATVGLALSGAPWLGLALGLGWLAWMFPTRHGAHAAAWGVWLLCLTGTLIAAALAWQLGMPDRVGGWNDVATLAGLNDPDRPRRYGQLLLWFTWPAGPLALWTLWRWRHSLRSAHVLLPSWFVLCGVVSAWVLGASDRALLMALPALACLGAFALPTLRRSITALVDWFALLFFTGGAIIIWVMWLAMQTGVPAKPAANIAKLVPSFEPSFTPAALLPALLASAAWVGLMVWRMGRHKPAVWKSLVLSAAGTTLCWLLLMTLWLPLLNHGMGQAPISERIAGLVRSQAAQGLAPDADPGPGGANCVLVHGLTQSQIVGLQFHGGLHTRRAQPHAAPGNGAHECQWLVAEPAAFNTLRNVVDLPEWTLESRVPRLRENRDALLVFQRKLSPATHAPAAGTD